MTVESNRKPDGRIKSNKLLYISAIVLLVYGIGESADCIYAFLITLNILPPLPFLIAFAFPAMQDIWLHKTIYMLLIFLSFTALRITAAIGILKNRLWGLWLALISTVLTLCVMPLFLPFGALDGVIAAPLLVLLLVGQFRNKPIAE
jgi:hypothetical protein